MYDDLNLQEEEDNYGMNNDNDRVSSQDTQSVQDETPEIETRSNSIPGKSKAPVEPPVAAARRPSTQMKSPLPTLATLHTPSPTLSNGTISHMKPAAVPTRAPGETLKYASAAAAAAASDKSNMGIAPLPPPPEALPAPSSSVTHPPLPSHVARQPSLTSSPTAVNSQPASVNQTPVTRSSVPTTASVSEAASGSQTKSPALSQSSAVPSASSNSQPPIPERSESTRPGASRVSSGKAPAVSEAAESSKGGNLLLISPISLISLLIRQKQLLLNQTESQMASRMLYRRKMSPYIIFHPAYKIYSNLLRQPNDVSPVLHHNPLKGC